MTSVGAEIQDRHQHGSSRIDACNRSLRNLSVARSRTCYTQRRFPLCMSDLRLGDVIDDHCVKCRRVTNHSIVSLVNSAPAKVRCRTCYNDHDYRHEQAPPSKKDLKKQELFKEVLSTMGPAAVDGPEPEEAAKVEKKAKARGKKA